MVKVAAAGVKQRKKPAPKPKLSDEERHARFVAVAREAGADETPEAFDKAFETVVGGALASGNVKGITSKSDGQTKKQSSDPS